jgi:hypothetical protein
LPRHRYDTARVVYRLCSIDGFVAWDGNRYAVPYDYVTNSVPIRITQQELFVYAADLRCVARHELALRGVGLSLDFAGLHPQPRQQTPINLDQVHVAFVNMGDNAARFFCMMSLGSPRAWGPQARQILLLRERYTTKQVGSALGHAARYGALGFASVERILAARVSPRSPNEYVAEEHAWRIEATLGKAQTEPRDLTEYDRLPLTTSTAHTPQHAETPCQGDKPTEQATSVEPTRAT